MVRGLALGRLFERLGRNFGIQLAASGYKRYSWNAPATALEVHPNDGYSDLPDGDGCRLCSEEKARWQPALPAGADAGAALPLQPGLRRLRQGAVPAPHSEKAAQPRGVLCRGRGIGRPDGLAARRRAALAPADCRDRQRTGGAQKIRLPVHQRPGTQAAAAGVHTVKVPDLFSSSGRPARAPRLRRLP